MTVIDTIVLRSPSGLSLNKMPRNEDTIARKLVFVKKEYYTSLKQLAL